jgi:oxygen-dependent protoporphyrinogen oxidase
MIAIIGGGISGLAAAYELLQRGVPFELLEASPRVGGLIETEHHNGFVIDAGPDSMLATKPAARDLCASVGLASALVQMLDPKTAFVLDHGRLYPLPSPSMLGIPLTRRAALRFDLLTWQSRLRVLLEPHISRRNGGDESIASFFRRRFGRATVERVAQPLLGGIHAGDVEQLSMEALFPNLLQTERAGSLLRQLAVRQHRAGGFFNSLASGMGTLPEAIARTLPTGTIHLNTRIASVTRTSDGWRLETSSARYHAAGILLATPVHATARLLQTIDADAARMCAAVQHASTASIALGWRRDQISHPLGGSGFVVARDASRITASTWISSKWPGRAPEDYTLLRAFVGGVRDPHAIDLSDEELVGIARRDLARILGIHGDPVLTRVYRWRDASPQLTVGHLDRIREVDRRLSRHAGLFVAGRGLRAVGIPDCVADAREVAAAAAEFLVRSHRESKTQSYPAR